jgi:hypothetical protein
MTIKIKTRQNKKIKHWLSGVEKISNLKPIRRDVKWV